MSYILFFVSCTSTTISTIATINRIMVIIVRITANMEHCFFFPKLKHNEEVIITRPLQWRHNERHGISNDQYLDCLLSRLFMRTSNKHQSSASLAFVRGIHWWPVDSPHKGPVTQKMFHLMTTAWMTSSNGNAFRITGPLWPVDHPTKGQ